jgi:hypothetical protein
MYLIKLGFRAKLFFQLGILKVYIQDHSPVK